MQEVSISDVLVAELNTESPLKLKVGRKTIIDDRRLTSAESNKRFSERLRQRNLKRVTFWLREDVLNSLREKAQKRKVPFYQFINHLELSNDKP